MLTPEQQKWGDPSPTASRPHLAPQQVGKLRRKIRLCAFVQWAVLFMMLLPTIIASYFIHAHNITFSFWEKALAIVAILVGIAAALILGMVRRHAQILLLTLKVRS